MASTALPDCGHIGCGKDGTITLRTSVTGLLTISAKAIPPLILATASPHIKHSPSLLILRDEMLHVFGLLHILQPYFTSNSMTPLSIQSLLTVLSGCVLVYSDLESLFLKSRGSVKRFIGKFEGIWDRYQVRRITQSLKRYSTILDSVVDVLQCDFTPGTESKVRSWLSNIDVLLRGDKYLMKRINFTELHQSKRAPSQSNVLPLIALSYYSALSLPIRLTDVENSTWYTNEPSGDPIFEELLQNALNGTGQPQKGLRMLGFPIPFSRKIHPPSLEDQKKQNTRVEELLQRNNTESTKQIFMFGSHGVICEQFQQMEIEANRRKACRCPARDEIFNFLLSELNFAGCGGDGFEKQVTEVWIMFLRAQHEIFLDEIPDLACLPAFLQLWGDTKIQAALRIRGDDCLEFFQHYLQTPTKLFQKDYRPTISDPQIPFLPRSAGTIGDLPFQINRTKYNILRSVISGERRKWIDRFENIDAIIYVVDVSEYDQIIDFSPSSTYLTDHTFGFQSVAQSRWFTKSQVMLLFTNVDNFRAKIASGKSPIKKFHAGYEGGVGDADGGLAFFTDLFLRTVPGRRVEVEYTYPKDKNLLGKVGECLSQE